MSRGRLITTTACLAVALSLGAPARAEAASPRATVTSVRGTVLVHTAVDAPPVPARSGMALDAGNRLEVLPKSRATLLLPWGAIKILRGGDSFTVPGEEPGEAGPGLLELSHNVATVFLASREKTAEMEKLDIRAGTRAAEGGLARVILLSPRNTAIITQRPTFVWSSHAEATSYTLTIIGEEGKVFETETSAASFPYGPEAPALKPGATYFWEVVAHTPGSKVPSGRAHFTILAPEEVKALREMTSRIRSGPFSDPEDTSAHYVTAHLFIEKGLYEGAARSLLRAARMNPNDQGLLDLLQGVYRQMQLDSQGIALFQELL